MLQYEIRIVGSHVEVYEADGNFVFSADTLHEAQHELAMVL